jgi:cytochrome c-type biogenesis protein CcmF
MQHDITHPHNELILTIEEGSSSHEARPELYYSPRTDGIMRKPYVRKSLLYDLYFSPEQIQETGHQHGLHLKKGEQRKIGNYTVTFWGYEMGQHDQSKGSLRVAAIVDIEDSDTLYTVRPAKEMISGEEGSSFVDFPASFGPEGEYTVTLDKILADQGEVVLDIPGLLDDMPEDRLIMDVSKKPLINLVWVGTTLVLIGGLIAFVRRRSELVL